MTGTTAYVDYASLFGDAEFIWTRNLKLDNQVLCRVTIDRQPDASAASGNPR